MSISSKPIVIAAGGTGGHIFPAEALAEVLHARGERIVLMTDKRFAKFNHGIFTTVETLTVRSGSLSGRPLKKIKGAVNLSVGILQAMLKLLCLRPRVVAGFGGYPSFPTMLAASALGIPTVIHEQNSVLGRTNRFISRRVTRIATSFPQTLMVGGREAEKIAFTGNPVRAGVRAVREVPYPALTQDGVMHILVTGGSQGASVFSDVVPAAIALLPAALQSRLRIDQQCRPAEIEQTRSAYAALSASVYLTVFFTDMPARLSAAHLVIARSGASTVAELAIAGRPAILVPYPSAMDNHQYYNANAFEDAGGGWVMAQDGFTPQALAARLESLLSLPAILTKAADAARKMAAADAAEQLADLVIATAQQEKHNA